MVQRIVLIIAALGIVVSCSGNVQDSLGLRRSAPNEFRVVSNPPLSLPPEFSLRPPVGEEAYIDGKLNK